MSATILPWGSGIRGFQRRDLGLKEKECLRTTGGWTLDILADLPATVSAFPELGGCVCVGGGLLVEAAGG